MLTEGVVTLVRSDGFFLEAPAGDGDPETSDGIFVFTRTRPRVRTGDALRVRAIVREHVPGKDPANLTATELDLPEIEILDGHGTLPSPVRLETSGRLPPRTIVDDDGLSQFDPERDGIDFWESLEGMRVVVPNAVVIGPGGGTRGVWVLPEEASFATGRNSRGGLTAVPPDENPERVRIYLVGRRVAQSLPRADVGDRLGDIEGIVGYAYGSYEVVVREPVSRVPRSLPKEETPLAGEPGPLTIGSFNVLELDPNDDDGSRDVAGGRYDATARHIADGLRGPAVVALEEIEDDSGSRDDGTTSAARGLHLLLERVARANGPRYRFVVRDPDDGADGGQPGSNIRVALLYDPERVELVRGSVRRIGAGEPSFRNARKPLAATFLYRESRITVVACHLTSKAGSDPLFGAHQPPRVAGSAKRKDQARLVRAFIEEVNDEAPRTAVIVLGDFNEESTGEAMRLLAGDLLANLTDTLPPVERYTYIYEGNGTALDHIFVSRSLLAGARYDIVHRSAEFADGSSDHDPVIASIRFGEPREQPPPR